FSRDWSSDVCSSDLTDPLGDLRKMIGQGVLEVGREEPDLEEETERQDGREQSPDAPPFDAKPAGKLPLRAGGQEGEETEEPDSEIGRASGRGRVLIP